MAAAARCVAQGASPMPSYIEILKCLELSDEPPGVCALADHANVLAVTCLS